MIKKMREKLVWQTFSKLLIAFIVVGVSIFFVGSTLSFRYLKGEYNSNVLTSINTIKNPLTRFAWNTNFDSVIEVLKGLLNDPYILEVKFVPVLGEEIILKNDVDKSYFEFLNKQEIQKIELIYPDPKEKLGDIYVTTGNYVVFNDVIKLSKLVGGVAILCLLTFYLIVFFIFRKMINDPLNLITGKLKNFDMDHPREIDFDYSYDNEIKQLITTINNLIKKQKDNKIEAEKYLGDIETKSRELQENEQNMQKNFEERINELNRIKDFSSKAKDEADNGKVLVDRGRDIVQKLVFGMRKLEKANKQLEEIRQSIHGINSKTRKINHIVSESRLLSFNAEIEAAQAGKFGKGFSVVASEMGNLALSSGAIAGEISHTLHTSLKDVDEYFIQSSSNIKMAKESSTQCLLAFKEVEESLEKIFTYIDEIVKGDYF